MINELIIPRPDDMHLHLREGKMLKVVSQHSASQFGRAIIMPNLRNPVINTDLAQGLLAAIEELDSNDGLTAGVLTGNGRGFCSGMDLKAFAAGGPPQGFDQFLRTGSQKPLIAAILALNSFLFDLLKFGSFSITSIGNLLFPKILFTIPFRDSTVSPFSKIFSIKSNPFFFIK